MLPNSRIERRDLGHLTVLSDDGGQGIIYRFSKTINTSTGNRADLLYKEYRSEHLGEVDSSALLALVDLAQRLSSADRAKIVTRCALPIHLVYDSGTFRGFTMPCAPNSYYQPMQFGQGSERTLAEVQYLLNSEQYTARRGLSVSDGQRLKILHDTAVSLLYFHTLGLTVGDFSAKNLVFRVSGEPSTLFLDADAMRLHGRSALPQAESPGWMVAEISSEELGTRASDSYKIGLLAGRLFARDQYTKSVDKLRLVNSNLADIARRSLASEPSSRPSTLEWATATKKALESHSSDARRRALRAQGSPARGASPTHPTGSTATATRPPAPVKPAAARRSTPPTKPSVSSSGSSQIPVQRSTPVKTPGPAPSSSTQIPETPRSTTSSRPRRVWWILTALSTVVALSGALLFIGASDDEIELKSAKATCTSSPSEDATGTRFSYEAKYAIDSDKTTAWRCDGDGVGQSITVVLAQDTEISAIAIIPGYAKTDPANNSDRYAQNRRISKVRYSFDRGSSVTQDLDTSPSERDPQEVDITRTARTITVTILGSAPPSSMNGEPRNKVAISDIIVYGRPL